MGVPQKIPKLLLNQSLSNKDAAAVDSDHISDGFENENVQSVNSSGNKPNNMDMFDTVKGEYYDVGRP